jgi:uncharacterized protein (DUF697 family)
MTKEGPHMESQTAGSETAGTSHEAHQTTPDQRNELAEELVNRFSMWSGAAGLIPVPIADIVAVGAVQVQMLRKLSELYGVPFSENRGKSLIAGLLGSIIPASSGLGIASAMKAVPFFGTTIAVLSMPALSTGATYLIGKVFIQHFASGGTLLDFNAPDYGEFIKAQADKLRSKFDAVEEAATESGEKSVKTAASSVDR